MLDRNPNIVKPQDNLAVKSPKPIARIWQRGFTYLSLVLVGAGIGFSGSYLGSRDRPSLSLAGGISDVAVAAPTPASPLEAGLNQNFVTNVVDKVGPAVVRIESSRTIVNRGRQGFDDPMFREFFGDALPSRPERQIERGTGSGFIINANGQILTNAHVVAGADTVRVILKDGRSLTGRVLGADPLTDVAVVKIEANNLPTVALGDSDRLRSGEWAIAIGNPLGLDNTVTTGIISGTGRNSGLVGIPDKRVSFIQTDAAINPGNSGGPLLNSSGEAIGMNTAIIQRAQGLGFAIPINTAKDIADELVKNGKAEHAYLGIQMATITPELKQELNSNPNSDVRIDEERGVLVVRVVPNSPAARAGLRSGDAIVKINGESITDVDRLQQIVRDLKVGSNLPLELRRQGQTVTLNVQTGQFPVQPS
ncbi:MAG: trypsin-like peptidase domain-containing protein [Cyanosarcina radialis HA8281-LM2]|nr:trypsin-like peptidase domain-containing protein [Cyanosarcina radialis HA8281-LM2]